MTVDVHREREVARADRKAAGEVRAEHANSAREIDHPSGFLEANVDPYSDSVLVGLAAGTIPAKDVGRARRC
ncbi:hypothetical protein [Halovalidus salilacus]|uniref:hypothetical protein n=1 Tax=Halovalidus salilacus TaxID=3075124 RepID=UPI003624318F